MPITTLQWCAQKAAQYKDLSEAEIKNLFRADGDGDEDELPAAASPRGEKRTFVAGNVVAMLYDDGQWYKVNRPAKNHHTRGAY